MYHSVVNEKDTRSVGRAAGCDLTLNHHSVSRSHATVQVTEEGYLAVQDDGSRNGTWLHRNGRWVHCRRVILGNQDRIRFGDHEVPLEHLVDLFGERSRVRLREGFAVRGKPLVFDGEPARPRVVLENPRRNPVTGDIEENRS